MNRDTINSAKLGVVNFVASSLRSERTRWAEQNVLPERSLRPCSIMGFLKKFNPMKYHSAPDKRDFVKEFRFPYGCI